MTGFCSEHSVQQGERQQGSAAAGVRDWLLVESRRPWGAKAPKGSHLDPRLEQMLISAVPKGGPLRVQLIRQPERRGALRRVMYVSAGRVLAQDFEPEALHAWAAAGGPQRREGGELESEAGWTPVEQAQYLVCTHGKRDRCCAKKGLPIFAALHALAPDRVWHSTHLGGHRFAPTVTQLPTGLSYGRVPLEAVAELFAALEAGRIGRPDLLRGRCDLSRDAQVAMGYLLEHIEGAGGLEASALQPRSARDGIQYWAWSTGSGFAVRVQADTPLTLLSSCDDAQPKPVERWRLVSLEPLATLP